MQIKNYIKNIKGMKMGMVKNRLTKKAKLITIIIVVIILLLGFGAGVVFLNTGNNDVQTTVESTLEEMAEKSDLSTIEYRYNSVATVYVDDEKQDEIRCYVYYEGIVRAGIDFTDIKTSVDEENKKIIITIPDSEIQSYNVDAGSLDFIYTKAKYEDERSIGEALNIAKDDLSAKISEDNVIFEMANENAKEAIRVFVEPWIKELPDDYELEIR